MTSGTVCLTATPEERAAVSGPRPGWRREASLVLAVLVAVTCFFYSEVVFLGKTLVPLSTFGVMGERGPYGFPGQFRDDPYRIDPGASSWFSEPAIRKIGQEFASGQFPLWNEDQGFGTPLLADGQSGVLDPLHLPVVLSGSSLAWDLYYLARVVLGAAVTYLFARTVGLAWPARFFLAIAYVFSGHFFLFGNNMWIEAYVLLPVILLGTELLVSGRARAGFAVTAVGVALDLLVGMPEVALLVLLYCAGYGGYRLVRIARQVEVRRTWATRGVLLGVAWIIGIALAAPLLLPLFEFVAASSRIASHRSTLGLEHAPPASFVVWFMPYLSPKALTSTSGPEALTAINSYVGSTVVVLALYGLYPARSRPYGQLVPFAAGAAALLMAKAFGLWGINELGRLPGLNVTQIPKWSAPVTGFSLALLASVGVHRLSTERARRGLAAALVAFGGLVALGLLANRGTVSRLPAGFVAISLGMGLACAISVWAVTRLLRPARPAVLRGTACCCLVAFELFAYAPHGAYQDRYDRLVEPPFVRFLLDRQAAAPSRIFAADRLLYPNFSSAYGLQDIRSLDALYIDRYLVYIQNFISPQVTDRFVGGPFISSEREALLTNNPWFDLAGVRYVITGRGPAAGARLQVGGGDDLWGDGRLTSAGEGAAGQYALVYDAEVRIYENRHTLPRAFLVHQVAPVADMEAAVATMRRGILDPAQVAVVEGVPPERLAGLGAAGGRAAIRAYGPSAAAIDVDAADPAFLVLSDAYYPGWHAAVDGHPATIYPTDLAFRGLLVPAGHHQVVFSYQPASFRAGLVIAGVGLAALEVVLAGGIPRRRCRHAVRGTSSRGSDG